MRQDQFLEVIDRDEAARRFRAAIDLRPLGVEEVPLSQALGRTLARDLVAAVDVPSFDRSNVDGFAVRAEDTFGATEEAPRRLVLNPEQIGTGVSPRLSVAPGTATAIATGAMIPRGADAVVMVEHTDPIGETLIVRRPVAPGAMISFAGTDLARGETVLRRGQVLTSRETGVLAAIGLARVPVWRRPRVAVISTGDELIPPGAAMRPGLVFDSNATILADAVRELGGVPEVLGIVPDDPAALRAVLKRALAFDCVVLSGGTSKGPGDVSYRVLADLPPPGVLAHGVALKPGKPICLAVAGTVPVVVLPGFPTSAIFTFHEFVAPVLRTWAGRPDEAGETVPVTVPLRINSERGRTEYVLVGLVRGADQSLLAYPMGKGSGSVTTFSRADAFLTIPRNHEYLAAGQTVAARLLGRGLAPADLVVIGSHCTGLDVILSRIQERGFTSKFLAVGSTGGLAAAARGECDVAGIHLLDPATDRYNVPFLTAGLTLLPGYTRMQGIVFRPGDLRFAGRPVADAVAAALADADCVMVNRNRGSGTRVLIDRLLAGARPPGYAVEARSHNAVAAAVAQGRADWGVAIEPVARDLGLGFLPLREEHYDFVIPAARAGRPAVRAFREVLAEAPTRARLAGMGFVPADGPP